MTNGPRIVIIGGVAGGASAATRARRLSEAAQITLVERGPDISYANCGLPYHIGGAIPDRERLLVQSPAGLRATYGIDVRVRTEALRIDRERKQVIVRELPDGAEQALPYDKLILSPGAEPVRPPMPGADDRRVHTLRSLADMDGIVEAARAAGSHRALVVGAGYIGLELTEAFRERGLEVTLVELLPQVMGVMDPEMVEPLTEHLREHGVDLRLGTSVTRFDAAEDGLRAHLSTGEEVACAFAVLAIGVRPESKLARESGLELGPRGGIAVDDRLRTSDPDILAVGDAIEVRHVVNGQSVLLPLAGPANRQGRAAADNALGRDTVYRGSQGTAICKVFDLTAATTGCSEKQLDAAGVPHEKVFVHPANHASYYPGAMQMALKLLYAPETGRILGAQVVGREGVDKRIDVLAVALRAGLTVFDLEHLELAYAPPYGSAKDPVNYAGFVAANALRGDVANFQAEELLDGGDDRFLLDVRRPEEVAAGTIPGAVNIPLQELRERLGELPADRELHVFCQVGLRGYTACRLLGQHGFRCRNLTGGYRTYGMVARAATPQLVAPTAGPRAPAEMTDDSGAGLAPSPGQAPKPCATVVRTVDARGLQCPGPIMQVAAALQGIAEGECIEVVSDDPAFARDIPAWCHGTGNTLHDLTNGGREVRAIVRKGAAPAPAAAGAVSTKTKSIVVFSGDFDKVTAAFIIANGAASMGSRVTLFFTFWGLNALRRPEGAPVRKTLIETMFGWMMPRGASRLKLSQMHMGGMGLAMIKGIMRKKGVASLPELIESAKAAGVRLVACTMSMDLMGIKPEELIDGVEYGGVASYLDTAEAGSVNLFV